MGLEVGGYENRTDWPKLGPSLLIATSLILAIRTAKWATKRAGTESERDLEAEIDYAAYLAGRVLSTLANKNPGMFPSVKRAWYHANEEDVPK